MSKYINLGNNNVPENKIVFYRVDDSVSDISDIVEPLKGNSKREWFLEPYYLCLPLTIANQYGFVIKSNKDIELYWTGEDAKVSIKILDEMQSQKDKIQGYDNNFRNGVFTVYNSFVFRTPPGINLMTIQPPNMFIPNIVTMSGVVEADNLRRDFTFNLKVTTPHVKIKIKKGDWLAAFIPVPRYFVDSFSLEPADNFFDKEIIDNEIKDCQSLYKERRSRIEDGGDLGKPYDAGRRYFKGVNFDGSSYLDHQKRI